MEVTANDKLQTEDKYSIDHILSNAHRNINAFLNCATVARSVLASWRLANTVWFPGNSEATLMFLSWTIRPGPVRNVWGNVGST